MTLTSCTQNPTNFHVTHVNSIEAKTLLDSKAELVVLDIRTPKEIKEGHIQGAIFADFKNHDFADQLSKLDRSTPYLVHCAGGGRSMKALTVLEDLGFTDITHLDGGMIGWSEAGLPITRSE